MERLGQRSDQRAIPAGRGRRPDRASVPKLTLKWAFGIPGGQRRDAPSPRSMAAACSSAARTASSTRSTPRPAASTGRSRPTAACAARSASAPLAGTRPVRYAAYFGDVRANVYAVDAHTGEQIWSLKVDDHPSARITGAPALTTAVSTCRCRRSKKCPARVPTTSAARSAAASVAIDARDRQAGLEDLHHSRGAAIGGKNAAGTPLWKPAGAAIWAAPTVDVARKAALRRHRQRLYRAGRADERRRHRVSLDTGAIQWVSQVTPNDAFVVGCRPGQRQLSRRCRSRFRLRQLADPADARQRPQRDRHRPEVRRRLRHRSGQEGHGALAVPRRAGQRARRHRVGLGRRRADHVRAGVGRARAPRPAACTPLASAAASASGTRRRPRSRARAGSAARRRSRRPSASFPASCSPDRSTATCAPTTPATAASSGTSTRRATSTR